MPAFFLLKRFFLAFLPVERDWMLKEREMGDAVRVVIMWYAPLTIRQPGRPILYIIIYNIICQTKGNKVTEPLQVCHWN